MKKTLSHTALLSAYKIGTAVLAALVGVFGTLAYLTSMTATGRYFTVSASVIILYVAIAVAVIFSFASAFLFPKGIGIESKSKIARYATVIPTVAIFPVIASYAKELLGDAKSTLTIIVAVSALISLIYFISTIFDLSKALSAFSGYILILFCIAVIAVLHTDSSVEMNSPVKISLQFTAAFTALSILSDIRNLIVGHTTTPESITTSSYVPVRKFVGKVCNSASRFGDFVGIKTIVHVSNKAIKRGKQPLIHKRKFAVLNIVFARIEFVYISIEYVERIGIPKRT